MAQIHFEVFARKTPCSPWTLFGASEDRASADELASELLSSGRAAGVKVVREMLDPESGVFRSLVVSRQGSVADVRPVPARAQDPSAEPTCLTPDDLRNQRGREVIGRVLDGWLNRVRVTPFELLHRADLADKLEASGFDLQHAVQKISLADAQSSGRSVHEIIRHYYGLVERACERVQKDERRKLFPDLSRETLGEAAERLLREPDRTYRLSGAVARALAGGEGWPAKVKALLDLADQASAAGEARKVALQVIEQPLCEIVGARASLTDLVGTGLDLGAQLAGLVRLSSPREVEMLLKLEPSAAGIVPELQGAAAQLGRWLESKAFPTVNVALARRVLRELGGPRRLRPEDPSGEIDVLRALAMVMTAASGPVMTIEEVQAVFVERSRRLVTPEFVTDYLRLNVSVWDEVQALVRLCENVAGAANKRAAARWLSQHLDSRKVEDALRGWTESPRAKLAELAAMQRAVRNSGLPELDLRPSIERLGRMGGEVESEADLAAAIARAGASLETRLVYLTQLATGEQAPIGPATVRARAELTRLLKEPATRAELAASPELALRVGPLLESVRAA